MTNRDVIRNNLEAALIGLVLNQDGPKERDEIFTIAAEELEELAEEMRQQLGASTGEEARASWALQDPALDDLTPQ